MAGADPARVRKETVRPATRRAARTTTPDDDARNQEKTMSHPRLAVAATAAALATGAALASVPATAAPAPDSRPEQAAGYLPDGRDAAQNARLQSVLDQALRLAKQREATGKSSAQAAVTVYYDDSGAPSFDSLIDQGAAIWNARVSNVQLVEGNAGNASLSYEEGSDPSGSYYYGDGHGSGLIFLDYDQANTYAPLRIVTHETGHALGLPDRYTQPCSKLMSGGGPGPSCTNPYPDSVEASEVDALWASGFASPAPLATVG
jgi:snapalysin